MGCFEESLVCYDEALKINSNNEKVLLSKSSILVTLERYAEGLDCLNKVVKLNPSLPEALYNKGNV
ncbi:peptide transporter, partial [Candidatus Bathyarchaeota archaeon]|nr:peptide transporter [Candidatus Bathyarchaeota archaeon]